MSKIKQFSSLVLLLFTSFLFAQSVVDKTIKAQAEEVARATLDGDYETLMKYTHPNIIKASGDKDNFINVVKTAMDEMKQRGFIMESFDIGDPMHTQVYKGEYQTLVPKTMTMRYQGKKIISKNYLFGFSNSEGKQWTFTEAEKLNTERGKQLFPNFQTKINIPDKEPPVTIDAEDEVETEDTENEEDQSGFVENVPEIDENAGTYDDNHIDDIATAITGILGLVIGGIVLIIGLVFLFLYLRKKNAKKPALKALTKPETNNKKKEKVACSNCQELNSAEAKYCAFCGHTV